MRAREFITEKREHFDASAERAIPNAQAYPALDNSNPYHSYRFGVALAGMPDHPMDLDGPTQQKLVTIGYSDADNEIINATQKHLGFKSVLVSTKRSEELPDTFTQSPVAKWK